MLRKIRASPYFTYYTELGWDIGAISSMLICAAVAYAGINLRWTLSVAICGALMSAFILGKYYDRNKKSTFWKKPLKKKAPFRESFFNLFSFICRSWRRALPPRTNERANAALPVRRFYRYCLKCGILPLRAPKAVQLWQPL